MSFLAPRRAGRRWLAVTSSGQKVDARELAARLWMNKKFAGRVYDAIAPGAAVIITNQPVVRGRRSAVIKEN